MSDDSRPMGGLVGLFVLCVRREERSFYVRRIVHVDEDFVITLSEHGGRPSTIGFDHLLTHKPFELYFTRRQVTQRLQALGFDEEKI